MWITTGKYLADLAARHTRHVSISCKFGHRSCLLRIHLSRFPQIVAERLAFFFQSLERIQAHAGFTSLEVQPQ